MSCDNTPTASGCGTLRIDDVNRLFDDLRESVLRDHPADPVAYLKERLLTKAATISSTPKLCTAITERYPSVLDERALSIVVLGASGDLAKKKTFPALFQLYCNGLLPPKVNIVGYARSEIPNVDEWKQTLAKYFAHVDELECHIPVFLERISYIAGSYSEVADFEKLSVHLRRFEESHRAPCGGGNRLFYLALPPTVFVQACRGIRLGALPVNEGVDGWARIIVEKPFGRDSDSSNQLSNALGELFSEKHLYRIDHYLGKEMVQSILTTRFANRVFSAVWNCNNIANVQITFKEKIGTEGRGGYFDSFGIIRDVVQNHLTQILALVAMEKPHTLDSEHIRNEKVALLRCVEAARVEDCVLGQYTSSKDGSIPGYLDDPTVPKGSRCPTFAMVRLNIRNDRWSGVPFLLKAGKALEDKAVVIRIQFKDELVPFGDMAQRNELVIRAQPSEAMYLKLTAKVPGMTNSTHQTELDLTYADRYSVKLPDAYESLIFDAIQGNATNFVRKDELEAAWKIFTPLLHAIDRGEVHPVPYMAGTRGPKEADEMIVKSGFKKVEGYHWTTKPSLL